MNEKIGITTALAFVGLAVAIFYLLAYWGSFGIQIFQFAGLTDFVKLAIAPIVFVFFAALATAAISAMLLPSRLATTIQFAPHEFSKGLRVITPVMLIAALILFIFVRATWKWGFVMALCGPASLTIAAHPIVTRYLPPFAFRYALSTFAVFFPLGAAMIGSVDAETIKNGLANHQVDPSGIAANLKATADHPVMYIGYVNETYFFYETETRSVVIAKQIDSAPLTLRPNPKACTKSIFGYHTTGEDICPTKR